ncbi:Riboflavin transporter [Aphelenchoides besseyi]|nr:Riboflavin transporter [Aphelenchoides besseyi]
MTTINPLVYVLVMVFGSSSWLSTNSVWLELSLLTQKLPEGWSLPSYLALIVQIACVGPLIYSVLLKGANITISAPPVIFVLLAVCTASEFLLAFFWNRTSVVFGENRSVTLMLFVFVMALVNSTSNVLFMPYMGAFHPSYLTAYFVGMGFSSLIPSIVSLAQGLLVFIRKDLNETIGTSEYQCMESNGTFFPKYSPARFHVREYTIVMGVWMMVALLAFTILHFFHENLSRRSRSSNEPSSEMESSPLKGERVQEQSTTTEQAVIEEEEEDRSGTKRYVILVVCLALICAEMNAVVPSIQSYATMSYSMLAYHMALTLSNLAHPLASFFANVGATQSLTAFSTVVCAMIVVLALQSPTPFLHGSVFGSIFTVVISIITAFMHAYLRAVLTAVLRDDAPNNESRLFWCGVYMQVGSFLGSVIMFPLVNVAHLFQSAPLCK